MDAPSELGSCPACGCRPADVVADREQLRSELEWLWRFHLRRLRPDTPPAHLVDRLAFSQAPPLRVVHCPSCALVYRDPRERGAAVLRAYADAQIPSGVLEALFQTQRRFFHRQARRLTRTRGAAGRALEVGSYAGAFLAAASADGWQVEGLDVNPSVCRFTRSLGFPVTRGTLEDLEPVHGFDAVAIWNCFEQLPDPRAAAHRARALLAPRGVLALRVPNAQFYIAAHRRLAGHSASLARAVLAHNNLLAFPYRHAFTPACLASILDEAGFAVLSVVGETLVPTADCWTRRWAALEERFSKSVLRLAASCGKPAPWFELYARVRQ